jgi:hypothetical protein
VLKSAVRRERTPADEDGPQRCGAGRRIFRFLLQRRPWRAAPALLAAAVVVAIFVNALFLQPGPHPAPIFSVRPPPHAAVRAAPHAPASAKEATGAITVLPRPRPPELQARSEPAAIRTTRGDVLSDVERNLSSRAPAKEKTAALPPSAAPSPEPAAGLVIPARQVMAVQRALGDFGYGQVKPTGVYDAETRAAIEAFESARRLPVTGQITDRLMRALVAMTGRPLN